MPAAQKFGISDESPEMPVNGRQQVMANFIKQGVENPRKCPTTLSKKGFREYFVMGIIEDDLPYTFGEKPGMEKLFQYVLPADYTIPSRKTVRRDLDLLHEEISTKITDSLTVRFHQIHSKLVRVTLRLETSYRSSLQKSLLQVISGQARVPYIHFVGLLDSGSIPTGFFTTVLWSCYQWREIIPEHIQQN
jgi:hypothetical protein